MWLHKGMRGMSANSASGTNKDGMSNIEIVLITSYQ